MGFFTDRANVITTYFAERFRYGLAKSVGPLDREVLFVVDGVGRFHAAPLVIRRALREEGIELGTILYDWQFGLWGEIWTDLMWLRRNRWMGAKLARELRTFRREHPATRIHLFALSAGAGIAVFAAERVRRDRLIDTLILACPALSPTYNLAPALRAVERCYALVSERDRVVLGLGTRLFGTIDRRFTSAAGRVGFRIPPGLCDNDIRIYERMREIRWSQALRADGNLGGHAGWIDVRFLRKHLLAMLKGEPRLAAHAVQPG